MSQAPYNRHISTSSSASLQGGFKLFGVRLSEPVPASLSSSSCSPFSAMRKSVSLGNLPSYDSPECGASQLEHAELETSLDGYVSDDLVHTASNARERKKGVPWTEEEHRRFLLGLQKLGKGDWRGISRNFVKTRTPTQVASHAQKYFLRRSNLNKRRRRSSLFDIIPELGDGDTEELTMETTDVCPLIHQLNLGQHGGFNKARVGEAEVMPGLGLPVGGFGGFQVTVTSIPRDEVMEEADVEDGHGTESAGRCAGNDDEDGGLPPFSSAPGIEVAGFGECGPNLNGESISFPFFRLLAWPNPSRPHPCADSKILKPTPVVAPATEESQRTPEPGPVMKPSPLSYKLLEDSSRQSAFHTMPSGNRSKVDTKESLSSAIRVA